VLLALPERRALCVALAGAVAGALLAPLALVGGGGFVAASRATASTSSAIFQPWQYWWFLGHHGPPVHGLFGNLKVGYRTAPGWIGPLSHPLIAALALALPATLLHARRSAGAGPRGGGAVLDAREALGLLALALLARCALDTWDVSYYTVPFLLALLCWDALGPRPLPLVALAASVLAWLDFRWLPAHASADAQAALFALLTLPLLAALAVSLYAPHRAVRLRARLRAERSARLIALASPEGFLRRARSAPWGAR
jgi:hypothetical protein